MEGFNYFIGLLMFLFIMWKLDNIHDTLKHKK